MTAFVLPNLDESTIKELRKRIPDMSEIDLRHCHHTHAGGLDDDDGAFLGQDYLDQFFAKSGS